MVPGYISYIFLPHFNFRAGFGTVWTGLFLKCTSLGLILAGEGASGLCCTGASLSSSLNPQIKGTWERAAFPSPVINLFWTKTQMWARDQHIYLFYKCGTQREIWESC